MSNTLIVNKVNGKEPYESIYKLNIGLSLDEYETHEALNCIFNIDDREKRSTLMTVLLNSIMVKGPTVSEIRGLLTASLELDNMLKHKKDDVKLPKGEILLGLAGSGKKGVKTFNISTPAAIVASANGAYIAKACSSSTSSQTGSSDFLSLIGIDLNINPDQKEKILQDTGIMFCSIENTTPKFAELYGGIFYAPHAMSYALAALSFPIKIDTVVYGLSHPNVKLSVDVLKSFNVNNAFVYTSTEDGIHYLDELGISGFTSVIGIKNGIIGRKVMAPIKDEFKLNNTYSNKEISEGATQQENIAKSVLALRGEGSAANIDAICINSALLLCLSKKANSLIEGYKMSYESIKSGKSYKHFLKVIKAYNGNVDIIEGIGDKNGSE